MKRLLSALLAALLLVLAGCTAKPDAPTEPERTDYYLTDEDIPLDERALSRAVPDFLTEEQQALYRQAFALYDAMFGGETTGIDRVFPAADGQTEYGEYKPDGSDYTYISSHSRWSWADFDRVVHGLFTDRLWAECNETDFSGSPSIYIEHDGQLYILDCSYSEENYNNSFPEEYALTAQTDERIDFTVTAHYSYIYPRWDETCAERDKRLETSYEYTRTYPVTLVYTDAGWRFDVFTTPSQEDGEWEGVDETDFYDVRVPFSDAEPPISAATRMYIPVPDFLTEEQQSLFYRAYELYGNMIGRGGRSNIDSYPLAPGQTWLRSQSGESSTECADIAWDGYYYLAVGRYQRWEDFYTAALSVFTEELFDELNACPTEKYPDQRVFIDYNGRLCYQGDTQPTAEKLFDRSDVFTLVSSDDERVEFTVHYDADRSYADLLPAYTDAGTIVMVRTDAGWRVSAFEYPN